MSHTFIEHTSKDPVEQAIARKVVHILNDAALERERRQALVLKAQRELTRYRLNWRTYEAVQALVAQVRLPKGYEAQCISVRNGVVHVGVADRLHGFVWLEAGAAPKGVVANQSLIPVQKPVKGPKRVRHDPIAERRKAMGIDKTDRDIASP